MREKGDVRVSVAITVVVVVVVVAVVVAAGSFFRERLGPGLLFVAQSCIPLASRNTCPARVLYRTGTVW